MPQRKPWPPEPDTRPNRKAPSAAGVQRGNPAPKSARERSEAPTVPPPPKPEKRSPSRESRAKSVSNVRATRPATNAATVDEVTADMSKDPRRDNE